MSLSMALASLRREAEVFSVSGLPSIVAKVFFVAAPVATPLATFLPKSDSLPVPKETSLTDIASS